MKDTSKFNELEKNLLSKIQKIIIEKKTQLKPTSRSLQNSVLVFWPTNKKILLQKSVRKVFWPTNKTILLQKV